MSEQEKADSGGAESVVLMEQTASSRHKKPYRPVDSQDDKHTESQHKRSKAPAVPSVTEDLKDSEAIDIKELKELEHAMTSAKHHKHSGPKKMSVFGKRRGSTPEIIPMPPLGEDLKKKALASPVQPIPSVSIPAPDTTLVTKKKPDEGKEDEDSITEEIAELRTEAVAKASSEWSDEEEAGGLPRSESRSSRVSRAVRQLFCCGIPLDPPSEHQISPRVEIDDLA